MDAKIGFIGAGHMGSAMIKGLIQSGLDAGQLCASSLPTEAFKQLIAETGITAVENNEALVRMSDVVVLAVKPPQVRAVLDGCKRAFGPRTILVSIAASLPITFYESILGAEQKIVRAMPNTPAMVLDGISGLCANDNVTDDESALVKTIFESFGIVTLVSEDKLSIITAIAGSSPAYAYMFIEAMADGAVKMGLDKQTACMIAAQALKGSARMVLETGLSPGALKDDVCSPGGTTIEAVYSLEKNGFRSAVMEAVIACGEKAALFSRPEVTAVLDNRG